MGHLGADLATNSTIWLTAALLVIHLVDGGWKSLIFTIESSRGPLNTVKVVKLVRLDRFPV